MTYLLTQLCRVLLEKLTGLQLVKKLPEFHGTRKFITALTSARHLSILGQPNPVHKPTSHHLEIHPNIIRPSTPRSPQWSPSLRFPHQNPIHPLFSPIRDTCPAHLILFDFITRTIYSVNYYLRKFTGKRATSSVGNSFLFPGQIIEAVLKQWRSNSISSQLRM